MSSSEEDPEEVEYEEEGEEEEEEEEGEGEGEEDAEEEEEDEEGEGEGEGKEEEEEGEEEFEEVEVEVDEDEDEEEEQLQAQPESQPNTEQKPPFLEAIAHLHSLHAAFSDFFLHYNSLQQTLDSVSSSLDKINVPNPNPSLKTPTNEAPKLDHDQQQPSDIKSICQTNAARALRKYIIIHLAETDRLRKEVPEALKLSTQPAKLVLEALSKFYIQGRKAFQHEHDPAVNVRRAAILLLEFYLLAGCPAEEKSLAEVKKGARNAAVLWRNRVIAEGGLEAASPVDALGLVLLVGVFGIPPEFRRQDLLILLRLSNLKKKGDVLRRSPILVQKVTGIINDLIAEEMELEAVDFICTFGLQEKFPPLPLLSAIVKRACDIGVQERKEGQCSIRSLKEADEKQLASLKSVAKCLQENKLFFAELGGINLNQKIEQLEKDMLEERKLRNRNNKRTAEDVDQSAHRESQHKHIRPSSAEAFHGALPQSIRQAQEQQGVAPYPDPRYAYNGYIPKDGYTPKELLEPYQPSDGLVNGRNMSIGGNGAAQYQSSAGQGYVGNPYSSGHNFAAYPAAAAQAYYQPTAAHVSRGSAVAAQQYHQPNATAAGHNYYQPAAAHVSGGSAVAVQQYHQPNATAAGHNYYQPNAAAAAASHAAVIQNYYQQNALHPAGGRNLYQFADAVLEQDLPAVYDPTKSSSALPVANAAATNPGHQSAYMNTS